MTGMAQKWFAASQVAMSMLAVQLIATGMQLLSKVVLTNGTFVFALMTYRHVVAALCMAPFAFFFEREAKKNLSWLVIFWLFVSSSAGILLAMGLFYYGIRDTSAAYSANFLILIPIVTFLLSVILRFEKLALATRAGKMKTLGALLCVAAALTMSVYKGKAFYIVHRHHVHNVFQTKAFKPHWAQGTLMLLGSCVSYASWYILQVKLQKIFPSRYWATMITCIIASIQSAVVGLCMNRSKEAWSLGWNLELVAIIYSGALATAATFCLLSFAVVKRGPTYPTMFNPLTVIFVSILEALLLGAEMTIGMLLGTALIIVGLYCFLLGKEEEIKVLIRQKNEDIGAVTTTVAESARVVQLPTIPTKPPPDGCDTDLETGSHNHNSTSRTGQDT